MAPGTKSNPGSGALKEFSGKGFLNFNGANRLIRDINGRAGGGGRFGPSGETGGPSRKINVRLNGNQQDGSNYKWFYGYVEVTLNGDGSDWVDVDDGATGDATHANGIRNRLEKINTGSGLTGIGVDIDNLPDGFELQPIPNGVIVEVDVFAVNDQKISGWFSAPNGVDGTCSAGGG